jgi:hypothetical protein
MGRKASTPTYRPHKLSGQAVCPTNRQTVYLGKHGSFEPIEMFNRLVAEEPIAQIIAASNLVREQHGTA